MRFRMILKYEKLNKDIFSYIENRIALNRDVMTISREVISKFPTWIILTNVEASMQLDIAEQLVKQAIYLNAIYKGSVDNTEKK